MRNIVYITILFLFFVTILVFRGYYDNCISLNVRDYLYAGDVGTEFEYATTKVYTDTNGIVKITHDTVTWIKVQKDTIHSFGAIEVRMDIKSEEKIEKPIETFLGYYKNSIRRCVMLMDTPQDIILKDPIKIGEKWDDNYEMISTIRSIGQTINIPYKTVATILVEREFADKSANIISRYKIKDYLAPKVLKARTERVYIKTYPSKKIEKTETITNLIRYTEKVNPNYLNFR